MVECIELRCCDSADAIAWSGPCSTCGVLAFTQIYLGLEIDKVISSFFDVPQYIFTLFPLVCLDLDLFLDELALKISYLFLCVYELGLQNFDLFHLDQVLG